MSVRNFFILMWAILSLNLCARANDNQAVSVISFSKPTPQATPVSPLKTTEPSLTAAGPFPIDTSLRKRVDFWIRIYTNYTTSQGVIHDTKYVDLIYSALDFQSDTSDFTIAARSKEKTLSKKIKAEKKRIQSVLLSIHRKHAHPETLNEEEKKIFDLYKNINEPNKFLAASHRKRVRFQLGQRDQFIQGLYYSGRYLATMERIFKDKGLPIELTRLPFVESSFNIRARSKVGASGIWQFMKSTGRLFLKINDTIDERNDPIRATEAAAQFLMHNFEALRTWPLAITAYNHGREGLLRAVRRIGSENIMDIIEDYKSRSFGFASSNFYAEFLAAIEVEKNVEKYFGKLEKDKPIEFAEFVMTDFVDFGDLATYTRIPMDVLQELNPSLSEAVLQSKKLVPTGYILRIPIAERDMFLVRYNEIPSHKKFSSQKRHLGYSVAEHFRQYFRRN